MGNAAGEGLKVLCYSQFLNRCTCCLAFMCGSATSVRKTPEGGHGYPLQYSCLKNPLDREAWWATVHGVGKSQIQLNTHVCFYCC